MNKKCYIFQKLFFQSCLRSMIVEAKTLAYYITQHNDFVWQFKQNRPTFISKSAQVSQAEALSEIVD